MRILLALLLLITFWAVNAEEETVVGNDVLEEQKIQWFRSVSGNDYHVCGSFTAGWSGGLDPVPVSDGRIGMAGWNQSTSGDFVLAVYDENPTVGSSLLCQSDPTFHAPSGYDSIWIDVTFSTPCSVDKGTVYFLCGIWSGTYTHALANASVNNGEPKIHTSSGSTTSPAPTLIWTTEESYSNMSIYMWAETAALGPSPVILRRGRGR